MTGNSLAYPAGMGRRLIATRYPPPATRGFTLVDVIVALALLAGGALASVAATAAAIRAISAADSQSHAVRIGRGRVELLAASGCRSLRDGSVVDSAYGIRERWTVGVAPNGARRVADSVEYVDHGADRRLVVRRLVVC